jgi:hypothetical protein
VPHSCVARVGDGSAGWPVVRVPHSCAARVGDGSAGWPVVRVPHSCAARVGDGSAGWPVALAVGEPNRLDRENTLVVRPPRYARSQGWGTGSAVCVLKIDWIKCRVTGPAAAPFPSNDPFHYRAGQLMTRIRLRPDVWLRTFVEMRVRLHRAHTHRFVRPMPFGPGSTSDLFVPDAILSR